LCEIQGRELEASQYLKDLEEAWPDIAFYTEGLRLIHLFRTASTDSQTTSKAASWCQAFSPNIGEDMRIPGMGPFGGAQAYYMASLIWIQFQIFLGKASETLSYIEKQRKVAEAQGLKYRLIELYLAESQARNILGQKQQSSNLIESALNLGKACGCLAVFNQGPALSNLLKEAAQAGIAPDYIRQIMDTIVEFPEYKNGATPGVSNKGLRLGQEQLSLREMEVLNLMALGVSNKEIADQLVVTIGTVKSHVNHILGKLDAHNRLEAVAHARSMGLLKI
jgi:LuxR family maltose regulon positive regulatory protein